MGHVNIKAIVLRLLFLLISRTRILALPLSLEEDGNGVLDGISRTDSGNEEPNKNWTVKNILNITTENDTGQSENVNNTCSQNINTSVFVKLFKLSLETNYYIRKLTSDEENLKVRDVIADSSRFYQTVDYELEPTVLLEPKSQRIEKTKMKRSSLFDNVHEIEHGREEGSRRPFNSLSNQPKVPPPKPYYWSWLFKDSRPKPINSFEETGETENVGKRSTDEESTNQRKGMENLLKTLSSEAIEESIQNLESQSDYYYDQEKNITEVVSGCDLDGTSGMGNLDNLTTQIHNIEVLLEQEIMEHNPGITTTEAVWNTDEFVDNTS